MANPYTLKVNGLDKILALFDQMPKRLQRELYAELKNGANEIAKAARADAPKDETRLRSSISVHETSKTQFEIVAQANYAGYIEFGTKSKTVIPAGLESIAAGLRGTVAGSGSLYEAIEGWVKRKGIGGKLTKAGRVSRSKSSQAAQRQTAFLIARSIALHGIKPKPFFYKQVPVGEANLRRKIANVIQNALRA